MHFASARVLDILPASNMRSTVSREVGEQRAFTHKSLTYTCKRARGQYAACPIACKVHCLYACARAASRTSALSECCATAVAPQNLGAAARGRSLRLSRLRPIGNLRPGRGGQATQTRRQQLVQDSDRRDTAWKRKSLRVGS